MTRPDLHGDNGGWQAIDATPQEESDGKWIGQMTHVTHFKHTPHAKSMEFELSQYLVSPYRQRNRFPVLFSIYYCDVIGDIIASIHTITFHISKSPIPSRLHLIPSYFSLITVTVCVKFYRRIFINSNTPWYFLDFASKWPSYFANTYWILIVGNVLIFCNTCRSIPMRTNARCCYKMWRYNARIRWRLYIWRGQRWYS